MSENPAEGRISEEAKVQLLRDARKKTVMMRREYREQQRVLRIQTKKRAWIDRHEPLQEALEQEIGKTARTKGPQNRATRRRYAKAMNVFKIPGGWQKFNTRYAKQHGYQSSVTRNKSNSIMDAMKAGE